MAGSLGGGHVAGSALGAWHTSVTGGWRHGPPCAWTIAWAVATRSADPVGRAPALPLSPPQHCLASASASLGREGRHHGFWDKVLVAATSSVRDTPFTVSAWPGHAARTSRRMLFWKQNRRPRNKPTHLRSLNAQRRTHEYTTGRGQSLRETGLGNRRAPWHR